MKVVTALKRLCEHCYTVRRGKKLYLRCKKHPRHKRRQGFSTINWIAAPIEDQLDPAVEQQSLRSYDGYKMQKFGGDASIDAAQNCCSCNKPLIYDMSARIKVKQDYIKMCEEAEKEE